MMTPVRRDLPSGTVTFLFTDVEGSTRLLDELGPDDYAEALREHHRIIREAFSAHGGIEHGTWGDAFFVVFPTAPGALAAAAQVLEGLAAGPIRVRMGIHTGTAHVAEEGYVGVDVHRAARIAACGHGGQVLVSASTADLLGASELRDLGEHRLKDLSAPERLYQLGDEDFPPLQSLHQTNLPIPSTPFLGRERELGEVLGLLSQKDVRLLTLTGPGGTGKTRLATQAAAELAGRYPHGVWWVPLASLRDPELVLETAGRAVGAKDDLAEHIADRSMLLLFDNFEQVVEAAGDIAALLASCPKLDLLVTSREPLHLTGEQEYPVPPLVHRESVGLFLARAKAVKPDFAADEPVAEICHRLDGLPLALELAAARVKALSSAQILSRLEQRLPLLTGGARDLPERQRTLRATIEWSYELLRPEEQGLFDRLAVFRGGCTLETAEEVCDADLDLLQSLVGKSLVRAEGERFTMLETIREYARERLAEDAEEEMLRRRHAEHYLALAEEADVQARAGEQRSGLARLALEHDNLRAALSCLRERREPTLVLRLARALGFFWSLRGFWDEGARWLEDALEHAPEPTAVRARALVAFVGLKRHRDLERSTAAAEEAIAIFRTLGDDDGLADSLISAGVLLGMGGAGAQAGTLLEEAVGLATARGDRRALGTALSNLSGVALAEGDYERATEWAAKSLVIVREIGDRYGVALSVVNLGLAAIQLGRYPEALDWYHQSLVASREIGWKQGVWHGMEGAGAALALLGDVERAARLIGYGDALRKELASSLEEVEQEVHDSAIAALRGQLGERLDALLAEGRALTLEEALECAFAGSREPAR
jgi:predicted ATPase/class 3 adenylate cyclase